MLQNNKLAWSSVQRAISQGKYGQFESEIQFYRQQVIIDGKVEEPELEKEEVQEIVESTDYLVFVKTFNGQCFEKAQALLVDKTKPIGEQLNLDLNQFLLAESVSYHLLLDSMDDRIKEDSK
jgi:hypothetical protein